MKLATRIVSALMIWLCLATCARGAFTAFWQPVTISAAAIASDPILATMQCWDLKVTPTGNWLSAGMRAVLPSGTFYNHLVGSNTKPNPLLVEAFPALDFDTYVSSPADTGSNSATLILGGFPEGQPLSVGGNLISCSWADLMTNPPGTFQIARLTFPIGVIPNVININDVGQFGNWSNTSQFPELTIEIPDVPEPTALGLPVILSLVPILRRSR